MSENVEHLGYARHAEQRLLSSLLIDHEAMAEVSTRLTPRSFTDPALRDIYAAMLHCWEARIPSDFTNVDAQLRMDQAKHATILDLTGLLNPDDPTWSPAYAIKYATRVRHAERFRRLNSAWQDGIAMMAQDADLDPAEVLMGVVGRVTSGDIADHGPLSTAGLIPALHELIAEEMQGKRDVRSIPTGFRRVDDITGGGMPPGELLIVAARPGMGKTSYALQLALEAARYGTAMIFSLEMDTDSIMRRLVSMESGVPYEAIRRSKYQGDQYDRTTAAMNRIAALPIVIDDTAALTIDQIKVRVQREAINGPVAAVVVDYLEMVGDRHPSEEQRLSGISRAMKQMCKELNVAGVLLSQLSREVERRSPPIPQMKDLRYSGALEAIADKIMFIYREDYYISRGALAESDRKQPTRDIAEIRIDKQRNGDVGIARLQWIGHCMSFVEPEWTAPMDQQSF